MGKGAAVHSQSLEDKDYDAVCDVVYVSNITVFP